MYIRNDCKEIYSVEQFAMVCDYYILKIAKCLKYLHIFFIAVGWDIWQNIP